MVLLKSTSWNNNVASYFIFRLLLVIAQNVLDYEGWSILCNCFLIKAMNYLLIFSRNCDKPRLIEALKTKRIRDIACGSSHSAAITSSGELYTWGLGEYGRLGHGDNTTQLKPKMVK